AQPGVFTTDGTQAIAVHVPSYSLATAAQPLQRSAYAFVYASGLGAVTNAPRTGDAAPGMPPAAATADVRVTIGGVPCQVEFAGLAPGFAGVYQVNFQVAPGVPSGSMDLVVTANGVAGPAVKVPVQ